MVETTEGERLVGDCWVCDRFKEGSISKDSPLAKAGKVMTVWIKFWKFFLGLGFELKVSVASTKAADWRSFLR